MAAASSPSEGASPSANASIFNGATNSSATTHFAAGPKLSIKLDDKNFLLWNQQVEGVVKMHKLHRLLVNPVIPPKYATEADRIADNVSEDFEKWLVQDQTLFTWLLSTLSESALTRVLTCHHSWQIWEKVQQHYFSHLKAKVRQLRSELKNTKKGAKSISEFVTKVHSLADSLISAGESVSDSYLIDVLLDGLPEEYNSFVMMIFSKTETPSLSEIESLLLIQESQLDKFRQELVIANATANVVQVSGNSSQGNNRNSDRAQDARHNAAPNYHNRGRGRQSRGRGRGRNNSAPGSRPTCQLCGRYGHSVLDCWFRFDETFVPPPQVLNNNSTNADTPATAAKEENADSTPTVNLAEALPLDATGISSTSYKFCNTFDD